MQIPPKVAASIEIEEPPLRRSETPIKLVFSVPSLAAAREAAANLGGRVEVPGRE
ncbi:MAG: hypothetical protein ABI085_00790 [Gemmatimonadaceae bacterium]